MELFYSKASYETRGQCASSPFSLRLCHASRSPQRGHGARRARHGRVRWALAPPSTTPPQVQCFLGAAFCVLHLQPDCVVVCLIGFVEWLCSRRWCLQCLGWALFIGSFATCSTCCTWLAAAWLCTPPAFGVCCFNSGSCRTLNSQRLARATEAQRVTYSASRRLEGHLRHRWQHSNSRRAHPPHCLHARAHPDSLGDEGTTDHRQPGSHHAAHPPGGRLDRHAGRHEQTYESRVRAGRHPPGRGNSLTRL